MVLRLEPDELPALNRCLLQNLNGSVIDLNIRLILEEGCAHPSGLREVSMFAPDIAAIAEKVFELFEVQGGKELFSPFGGVLLNHWLVSRLRKVSFPGVDGRGYFELPVHALEVEVLTKELEKAVGSMFEFKPQLQDAAVRILEKLKKLGKRAEPYLQELGSLTVRERIEKLKSFQKQFGFPENALNTPETREDVRSEFAEAKYTFQPKPLKAGTGGPNEIFDIYSVEVQCYDEVQGEDGSISEKLVSVGAAEVIRIPSGDYDAVWLACDCESGDLVDAYENCFDKSGQPLFSLGEPVWLLNRFQVEVGYERIVGEILRWIFDYICRWMGTVVFLPILEIRRNGEVTLDESPEVTARIREFFASQGFIPLGKTKYMFFELF